MPDLGVHALVRALQDRAEVAVLRPASSGDTPAVKALHTVQPRYLVSVHIDARLT